MRQITTLLFLFLNCALWSQNISFKQQSVGLVLTSLRDIKAADMDGDGNLDALATGGGQIMWFKNTDGKGTFSSVPVIVSSTLFNLNVGNAADLDGDGDLDVLVGAGSSSSNSEVAWFKNLDGKGGSFSSKITLTTQGDEFREVIAADFDGDLDLDIVFGSYDTDQVRWMRNTDGKGTFSAPVTLFNDANGVRFMAVADVDADNDADFFTSVYFNVSTGQFSLYRNTDGMGNFTQQNVNDLDGNNAAGIAAGDVDGDGDADLVACIYNSDRVYWYRNNGDGTFSDRILITSSFDGPFSVNMADLEGDGDKDLVVAAENGNKLGYLLNNGQGTFSAAVTISTGLNFLNASFNASRLIATADIDKDGDADILAISSGQNQVVWFEQYVPLSYSSQVFDIKCNGAAEGAIFIKVMGGEPPYSLVWSDTTLQGDTLTGLPAGTYQMTLIDSDSSQYSNTFTLTEPPALAIATASTPTLNNLNNGTAAAFASGGTAPYTYLWNNGAVSDSIFNLPAGTYTVVITDANTCTQTNTVEVKQTSPTRDPGVLSEVQVWPNPSHDRFYIDLSHVLPQLLRLEVMGVDGRMLRFLSGSALQPLTEIIWDSIPADGFVLVVLHGRDGSTRTQKVIVVE